MTDNYHEIVARPNTTLRDVMSILDKTGQGVTFIVDENRIMKGLLTDGDVRRALLSGASIADPAHRYMNRSFVAGSIDKTREENTALLNDKIRHLPILDPFGHLIDMLRWKDLWRLPVMEPVLKGREAEYVGDCLSTNWISSQGKYVERFQEAFQKYLSVNHALCVSNGTAALHLAMAALGIGRDNEVIVPDLTFIAPASMTVLCGAKPVFADVDPQTWTMNPSAVEEQITERTRAIVPVHLYGHPCDMDQIMKIARRHKLYVIEDCAEALGAEYRGRKVGTLGDIATFSFFANKVITTGEGGMVVTNNPELQSKMQILRDHGMTREKRYWHNVTGFNYRLTNLQAAIGLAQLERIDAILEYRNVVVARYDNHLRGLKGVILPPREAWARNICWLYSIVVDERAAGIDRDTLLMQLGEYGIDTRPFFYPLHQQPPFAAETNKAFPFSEWVAARGLSLPTSNNISMDDVDRVCNAIKSIVRNSNIFYTYNPVNKNGRGLD